MARRVVLQIWLWTSLLRGAAADERGVDADARAAAADEEDVDLDAVENWAFERREDRIARYVEGEAFNRTGFQLVKLAPKIERGFLLAATKRPIERLRRAPHPRDELGALLRDVCATKYPAKLMTRTSEEAARARKYLPCDRVTVEALPRERRRLSSSLDARLFKVDALERSLPLFKDGTLYLDNDVALKRGSVDELFGYFDELRKRHRALGVVRAHVCVPPGHRTPEVPPGYCERNSGVLFFQDQNQSKALVGEWLAELTRRTSADGQDQLPLRKVLWRHRDDVWDLPYGLQCRGRRCDPCAKKGHRNTLLWHAAREDRVRFVAKRRPNATADDGVCGFYA